MRRQRVARQLLEHFPTAGMLWQALGLALQFQGRDARPILLRAAQLLPHESGVFVDLGAAFQLARQLDQAGAAYRRSLSIARNTIEALSNLGNVLSARRIACSIASESSGTRRACAFMTRSGQSRH